MVEKTLPLVSSMERFCGGYRFVTPVGDKGDGEGEAGVKKRRMFQSWTGPSKSLSFSPRFISSEKTTPEKYRIFRTSRVGTSGDPLITITPKEATRLVFLPSFSRNFPLPQVHDPRTLSSGDPSFQIGECVPDRPNDRPH